MHVIIMLLGIIISLSVGVNLSWFVGVPLAALSLMALNLGSSAWREKQEGLLMLLGLICGGVLFLG